MFIRTKNINSNHYAYIVKNFWTDQGPRQKVVGYAGKMVRLNPIREVELKELTGIKPEVFFKNNSWEEIAELLIVRELLRHGFSKKFSKKETLLVLDSITVDISKRKVRQGKKRVALAMNEGYLCDWSLEELLKLSKTKHPKPEKVASIILESGLKIEKTNFVLAYKKLTAQL